MERSTVRDSVATGSEYPDGGGGLAVQPGARAVLVESTIADCTAVVAGGGVCLEQANISLHGSRVERCRAALYGGGIEAYDRSHVDLLEGSVISDCSSGEYTGGLELYIDS